MIFGKRLWLCVLVLNLALLVGGCASGGYTGVIPVAGKATGPDTPGRRLEALDAAEQILLSRGYAPLNVDKEKGYMNYMLEADSDTVYKVNVRLVDTQSGKNTVEMDVDMRILRTEPKSTGIRLGGGIGIGTGGGGGFGFGMATPSQDWNDDDIKFALKKEIAEAVEKVLAR